VLESTKTELQKVKRDLQEQQASELKSLQKALNYKYLYEQSLQDNTTQMEELTKCKEQYNQLLQQEKARLNEMVSLRQDNISQMEELTKCRYQPNQLMQQQNDQL
jgi:hypothetical protein